MADDEDYMSSAFLEVKEDVRPGLTHSRSLKRKHAIEKRKEESRKLHYTKSRKELEEEQRNAGLDRALTSENKGFALLQKMGYKPGMKLGKQASDAPKSGLEEPIKVKIKAGRGGLGREELIREKIAAREKKKSEIKVWKEKETAKLTEEYRQRMRDKVVMKQLSSDLKKSQRICERLDSESGVEEPLRPWFWFSNQSETADDDDEDDYYEDEEEEEEPALEPEEQLCFILEYLRSKYYYCVWCGTKYEDDSDMESNCPGTEKDDHE